MRPYVEKLPATPGASWSLLDRRLDDNIPFQWHHHPELELTLTLNSRGQRFVGDHVGEYDDGDLVLVGPNLPHTWSSREKIVPGAAHVALVMWFRHEWATALGEGFVELEAISDLVARAGAGLAFSRVASERARGEILALFALPAPERLLALIRILTMLAGDAEARTLASTATYRILHTGAARIDRVLDHIHGSYARRLPLVELADIAALSLSGLHRTFHKHTRTTVSDYVMRLRIGEACARLSGTEQSVRHIAEAVGYNALANFNRQFRALLGMTPRAYRQSFRRGG